MAKQNSVAVTASIPVLYAIANVGIRIYLQKNVFLKLILPRLLQSKALTIQQIPLLNLFGVSIWTYAALSALVTTAKAWSTEGYDNASPRDTKYNGLAWRLKCAHDNSLEYFPLFAATMVVVSMRGLDDDGILTSASLSTLTVLARVLYVVSYVFNWDGMRSLCYMTSVSACLWLLGDVVFPDLIKRLLLR